MATANVVSFFSLKSILLISFVFALHSTSEATFFVTGPWKNAHATFYGQADGSGAMGGACGYDDVKKEGYGVLTAALSPPLFKNGKSCGSCYEIRCANDKSCKPGNPSVTITATNLCPPSNNLPSAAHFDMSQPAFLKIAEYKAGIVPVQYRRVPCQKKGGMHFTITGNPYFNLVLVTNVAGAGDITNVEVQGDDKSKWLPLTRNWGERWQVNSKLVGQKLSFRVTTSDGQKSTWKVCPKNWQFGQTFVGNLIA